MRSGLLIVLLTALVTVNLRANGIALAQTPEKTTNQAHPFAKQLEGVYLKYLEAARKGDVKATLALMSAEYAKMADQVSPATLKGMSADELDPKDAQFVGVDVTANKQTARAVYQKLGKDRKEWSAVVFRNEGGQWKIAKVFKHGVSGAEKGDGLKELLKRSDAFMGR
ncbi:MAG: nuclear transport factor 2 family protein [Deltaproteobacteria bacterium]|nr:nuclear transport factor 2 family protein [Deltaproteobacteria bacterium]